MDLKQLIEHPELMDRETLYDLRSFIALHPYYQTARILLLLNLYILHDAAFDEELRTAAIYVTDRRVLFNMIEAGHYKIYEEKPIVVRGVQVSTNGANEDRTEKLIDSFLNTLPQDEEIEVKKEHRRPTQKDATVDYVAYLMNVEAEQGPALQQEQLSDRTSALIDHFMEDGGFNLKTEEDGVSDENYLNNDISQELGEGKMKIPPLQMATSRIEESSKGEESYFTETLSRIYIKQGRYEKALEIITQLNLNIPKKNAYFADQIRFLEKLIINNKHK
ncbi:MAG: tetratricopeptide repeat protein [Prevotella sp.]|nr:tetratricopeptide repeat protein [Prevotella sp.]MBF1584947.1 tetratricopeptide repeat protein [Prevotella sp.]